MTDNSEDHRTQGGIDEFALASKKPTLASLTFVVSAISLLGSLITIWQAGFAKSQSATLFFFFSTVVFFGAFTFVAFMAIRLYALSESRRIQLRVDARATEERLEAENGHHRKIITWEQDKARETARIWHELCHDEREALLKPLGEEHVFYLLQKHCELVREVFGSGYPDFQFHVTIKMFIDNVRLANVARDRLGILQNVTRDGGSTTWRDYDVHSSVDEDGDSDFVLLTRPRELTPLEQPNRHRVWASDDLHCVQGCSLLPDGEPYRNKSKNFPCFYDATMVAPIRKSYGIRTTSGTADVPEFLGFLCVDTLLRGHQHPRIFGDYDHPNDTFAFVLRATADILYCLLKNGMDIPPASVHSAHADGLAFIVDPKIRDLAMSLNQRFCEHARAVREERRV
jgi:hypothetical protein